ncbi:MAG: hypothetical protein Q8M71_05520 [Thermodesulfovibrionales bacterium]|nr:hypothetical protein [Thermodesulfovibrionales bacterium]
MSGELKSGQEILDEFFSKITGIDGVDKEVAEIVLKLYKDGKLTNTNLSNELSSIRDRK